jgi:hypothetical protein
MALDQAKLIQQFDYLSTVSGGGYIGGWLSKLLKVLGDECVTKSTRIFEAVRQKEKEMGAFEPAGDAKTSERSEFDPPLFNFCARTAATWHHKRARFQETLGPWPRYTPETCF